MLFFALLLAIVYGHDASKCQYYDPWLKGTYDNSAYCQVACSYEKTGYVGKCSGGYTYTEGAYSGYTDGWGIQYCKTICTAPQSLGANSLYASAAALAAAVVMMY